MTGRQDKSAPPFVAAKLWLKKSAKGHQYLTGRLGGARVLIMSNKDKKDDGDATHVLMFAPAGEPRKKSEADQ